jgi:hypothetical protein
MKYDSTNKQRLSQLQPQVEKAALAALAQAEKEGIDVLITQGLRTYAEQNALYAKGRTAPGKIVTNARGGYSYHNFGLAFDICLIEDGKAVWNVNSKWKRFAAIAKAHGFKWGGDWQNFKDYPHFEMTGGLSLAQCRTKWPNGYKPTSGGASMSIEYKVDNELPISLGAKGDLVKKVQERLKIKADGYFGPATEQAVKNWQKAHGLVVDGIVGPKTYGALFPPKPKVKEYWDVAIDKKSLGAPIDKDEDALAAIAKALKEKMSANDAEITVYIKRILK